MIHSENSFTLQDRSDARESFALWQTKTNETLDEFTMRKRKNELYALVRRVIHNELDSRQQEFVKLHWYEEKSLSEISEILGLDRSCIYRMDKKINEIIYDKLKYAIEYRFGKEFSDKAPLVINDNRTACCPVDGKSIALRLRDLRLRESLDPQDVSKATGIKKSRLELLEAKGEQITADELTRLVKLFGTTSDYIIFGTKANTSGRSDAV